MTKRCFVIVIAFALLIVPASLRAQAPRDGRLLITVADPSGAVIPNALVTVVDQAGSPESRAAAATP